MENFIWENYKNTVEDYVAPEYYNQILKEYVFNGLTDLKIFRNYLDHSFFENILELGSGSGRATDIFLDSSKGFSSLDLLDQSNQMISFLKNKYSKNTKINYLNSDHLNFMKNTIKKYDLVYSLWSLSHSIHAFLHSKGLKQGAFEAEDILLKFIENNINMGGEFYIVHFDSMSDEQKILMRQWRKVFPIFKNSKKQSPSKLILDRVFNKLDSNRKILFSCEHFLGEGISYKDENEYLEIFMNLHLETFFNKTEMFDTIKNDLLKLAGPYKDENGRITIAPACYIYKIKKL